jgi:hypothetical protein
VTSEHRPRTVAPDRPPRRAGEAPPDPAALERARRWLEALLERGEAAGGEVRPAGRPAKEGGRQ